MKRRYAEDAYVMVLTVAEVVHVAEEHENEEDEEGCFSVCSTHTKDDEERKNGEGRCRR